MIRSLELKNFKSIKRKSFHLKNLNLHLGLNGMGKSSFIQSLLALRQSELLTGGILRLNGKYVKIGTSKDALYQYAKKDENLTIGLQFDNFERYQMEFNYAIEADVFTQKMFLKDLISDFLDQHAIQGLFSENFQYLNANRVEPKSIHNKSYTDVVINNSLGNNGEFTAHFIETHGNVDVLFDNLLHKNTIVKDTSTLR